VVRSRLTDSEPRNNLKPMPMATTFNSAGDGNVTETADEILKRIATAKPRPRT
jgi:hypothetical protein